MPSTNASITTTRPLTPQQLQLLTTLYKFRYITAQLVTSSQAANYKQVINARLKILVDHGYIGKNYDSSYKIIGKPASYYLLPKGIQVLRQQSFADPNVLKRIYYDKNKDDNHIAHRLNVFKTYIAFKRQYPNQFQFYSKSEIASRKYLPLNLADAYLKRNKEAVVADKSLLTAKEYLLTYYEPDMPGWQIKNSIRRYIAYAEKEEWQAATKRSLPTVLLACESEKQTKTLLNKAEREKENSWARINFEILVVSPGKQ